jgi:acetolactate synthase I/II/III large subunit
MKAVDGIASILKQEGVEYLFCYPTNTLIEAAAAARIRPIVCRQERVGVGMADGYSRISNGQPVGVFTSQYGPGAENAYAGIATAFQDSTPLLALPHGEPTGRQGIWNTFQPARAFEPISKSAEVLNRADRVGEIMRRAFSALRTGRPGPVTVEIPNDVASQDVDDPTTGYASPKRIRSAGDPRAVDEAARVLLEARCPVIFAGQGVRFAGATSELVRLAELLQAPVMTTMLGKGSFPEDHPLSAGTAAGVGTGAARHYLGTADVFLAIGSSLTRHQITTAVIPRGRTIIHATGDPKDLNKDYVADYGIVGDAQLVLGQLCEAVEDRLRGSTREAGPVAAAIAAAMDGWLRAWMPKLGSDEVPINPYRAVWEITKAVDPNATIVTHDSGSPRSQMVPFYRAGVNGYIGFGKAHALGSGLGLIMGAKLAAPDKLCINWMGDAAFGMVGTDFETATRNNIPILTIVSNNFEMAVETTNMRLSHEIYQTRKTTGNYADMARAMGGYAERIERPADIAPAIERAKRATEEGKAALLELITCPETATSPSRPD